MAIILVGEDNPYGGDDEYAFYPAPDGCSGHRLCCLIMGMTRKDYLGAFRRLNLCEGGWSLPLARTKAATLKEEAIAKQDKLVLCGSKVCSAFRVPFKPFALVSENTAAGIFLALILPHPSGRNAMWNDRKNFAKARQSLRVRAGSRQPNGVHRN